MAISERGTSTARLRVLGVYRWCHLQRAQTRATHKKTKRFFSGPSGGIYHVPIYVRLWIDVARCPSRCHVRTVLGTPNVSGRHTASRHMGSMGVHCPGHVIEAPVCPIAASMRIRIGPELRNEAADQILQHRNSIATAAASCSTATSRHLDRYCHAELRCYA